MKRKILLLVAACLLFPSSSIAVYDPLSVPNNRIGVHILDPNEIHEAAKLVNSAGGRWGYVTIPMRSDDRDFFKWLKFFQAARQLQVVPIIRLTTYVENRIWAAPNAFDLVDFANFLSDLPWPVKNRYIILFNEPNHAKEWGGDVDPGSYASLVIDANRIFKSRSQDYYLISAGLDMSAPSNKTSIDALEYYRRMTASRPEWYQSIDALGVHPYPNPGFVSSPYATHRYGITSYRYETRYLKSLGFSGKPLFITETGYLGSREFFRTALTEIWTEPDIVAVTPFLLFAGSSDFSGFSLLDLGHQPKKTYLDIAALPKTSGSPLLAEPVALSQPRNPAGPSLPAPKKPFSLRGIFPRLISILSPSRPAITVGPARFTIEIADNPDSRSRGLSGRSSLPDGHGMLFLFDKPDIHSFWMVDMQFPLDFVWISENKVVQIHQNIPPPSETSNRPVVLTPEQPVSQVLELPAGTVAKFKLEVGNPTDFSR